LLARAAGESLERVISWKSGFDQLKRGKERAVTKDRRAGHLASLDTKEGDMRSKCVLVLAAIMAITLGTARPALADNNADGSVGTVQTGNVSVTPSLGADQGGTTAAVSAPTSIAGSGDNTASNSVGAVQVGGGNTSSSSTGSVQVSSVSTSPSASAGAAGSTASAGVPVTVGSGGNNTASGSVGAVQLGGNNSATRSFLAVQSGAVTLGSAAGAATPAGAVTASNPVAVGSGGSNSTSDSVGAAQIGGGNTASGSTGTVQSGPVSATPSITFGGMPAPGPATVGALQAAGGTATTAPSAPASGTAQPAPGKRVTTAVPSPQSPRNTFGASGAPLVGQLPFTGLVLLLFAALGLALMGTGLGIRAHPNT